MPKNSPKFNRSKKGQLNDYARYSAIGMQIAVIIFVMTLAGVKADELLNLKIPIFTVLLSLLSVLFSMIYLIRNFNSGK